MSRVTFSLAVALIVYGMLSGTTVLGNEACSASKNDKDRALALHDLRKCVESVTTCDAVLSADMQKKIWNKVFSLDVHYMDNDLAVQFKALTDLSLSALRLDSCMTNRTCLIQFADHLGRMSERNITADREAFKKAMEADEALGFGSKPMARETGSRGNSGPNMKRLKAMVSRSRYWNHCVGLYRERVLGVFRQNLSRSGKFNEVFDVEFERRFIARAKLPPHWFAVNGFVQNRLPDNVQTIQVYSNGTMRVSKNGVTWERRLDGTSHEVKEQ